MTLTLSTFDGAFYGIEIGRLELDAVDPDLDVALARAAAGFDVLFLRVSEEDKHSLAALESRGLQPLETLVTSTLSRPVASDLATAVLVEESEEAAHEDLAAICAITAEAIRHSHLHADPRLPVDQTRALYAAWARNDATGRAQRTFIAREAGEVVGYLSVVISSGNAIIDLVAVRAASRGHGIGSALLTRFLAWHATTALGATVGTQVGNPALTLYHRFGFSPTQVHSNYHLWLDR